MIAISVDNRSVIQALEDLRGKVGDLKPAMREILDIVAGYLGF